MAIYATKQDLEARDESMLYNLALDRSTDIHPPDGDAGAPLPGAVQ